MICPIECKQCGKTCGSYDTGRTSGPVDSCYPPEYVKEPATVDKEGNEFCSDACMEKYTADHRKCASCQITGEETTLTEYDGEYYCAECAGGQVHPEGGK